MAAAATVAALLTQPGCDRSGPTTPLPETKEVPSDLYVPSPGDQASLREIDPRLFTLDPEIPDPELLEMLTRLQACRKKELLPKVAEMLHARQWETYVAEKRCDTLMRMPRVRARVLEVDGEFVWLEIAPQPPSGYNRPKRRWAWRSAFEYRPDRDPDSSS